MNKHKGKKRMQKRPNYKNVGEEEDEERGPTEDAQEDAEKAKGTEGGSKSMKTSGEREGECTREQPFHPRQPLQSARLPCPLSSSCSSCVPWVLLLFSAPTSVPHSGQLGHSEATVGCAAANLVQAPPCVTWSKVSYL